MMGLVLSLYNVMRKELTQILRDRAMARVLLLGPIVQVLVFGFAIDLDVDQIPAVVCDQDGTRASRDFVQAFFADRTFVRHAEVLDPNEAQQALESGDAAVALVVGRGFATRLGGRGEREVQVLIDGTDSTRAQVAANAAGMLVRLHGGSAARRDVGGPGATAVLVPRIVYNQRLKSSVYMLPGVVATLLLQVTTVITAMGLARERESGTLEQVLVTPIRPTVLLAGKCLPFILFGLVDVCAVLLLASLVFDVPIRGSLGVVGVGAFLYLFSTLGTGILLAAVSSTQQQALLGAFGFLVPAAFLSGFMSPIQSMPGWLQLLTLVNPMRHFLEVMRGCLLKGAGFADLGGQLLALGAIGTVVLALAVFRFRKRLA